MPVQRGAGAAAGLHAAWCTASSLCAAGRVSTTKPRPRSARSLRDARRRCCSRPPSGEQRDGPGGAESWSTTSVRVLGDSDEVLERPDDVSSSPCYWSCGAARRTGRAPRLQGAADAPRAACDHNRLPAVDRVILARRALSPGATARAARVAVRWQKRRKLIGNLSIWGHSTDWSCARGL